MTPVTIKSYLPEARKERSKLQQVKDKHRSFTESNKERIPKDYKELRLMKCREHAIKYLNDYLNLEKKTNKSQYCKTNHISHNTLNQGLLLLGHKTRINKTNQDESKRTKTNSDDKKPIKKSKSKIVAGQCYDDSAINEMINSSLDNLKINS